MQFSKVHRVVVFSAGSVVFLAEAHAQISQSERAVDEIVVTSSRILQPLRRIGTSMSVISADDIKAQGNLALTDVLRKLPAVSTSGTGGTGKPTSLRIRGEEGFRTLTIIDGLRLLDPSTTQVGPQFEHLLSDGIGRVEILRGPQGLGYGADAGGIVNLGSLRVDDGFEAGLDAQRGRFGTQQYSAHAAGGNNHGDFFLSVTDFETEGFNSQTADDVLKDSDGYTNTTYHVGGKVNITERLSTEFVHRMTDGDAQFDGCFDAEFTLENNCNDQYGLAASRVAATFTATDFAHSIAYSVTSTERKNFTADIAAFASEGEIERFEYVGNATALPGFDLVFGADTEKSVNNQIGRDNHGMFLELLSDFSSSLFITAGVRHDENDDFGTNDSQRVSVAYLIEADGDAMLKFKSSYGTGFRAPSPYEISFNAGPFSYPPAAAVSLSQERSRGFEAGLEYWRGDALHFEAVYFHQQVQDAIYFDLDTFSGYLQDTGTSTSHGVELSGLYALNENWRINGNFTYNPTERPNGQQRLRRPEQLMNMGVTYSTLQERLNVNAFYRISRDSVDEASGVLTRLEDFAVLDLSAGFNINDAVQLHARIENVLDERYEEVAGYSTAGRAAYVGIRMSYAGL